MLTQKRSETRKNSFLPLGIIYLFHLRRWIPIDLDFCEFVYFGTTTTAGLVNKGGVVSSSGNSAFSRSSLHPHHQTSHNSYYQQPPHQQQPQQHVYQGAALSGEQHSTRGSPATGGIGSAATPAASNRKWVPPSALRRENNHSHPRNNVNKQHYGGSGGNNSRGSPASNLNVNSKTAPSPTFTPLQASHSGSNLANRENDDGAIFAHNDAVFRKIRGILNKLTPEKFEKLINDVLNCGLDSSTILKGVILLIFEKALDEPKYSSMYAQLCRRLVEKAPNFDPPNKPCTFKRLLLNKCRDEFENRAALSQEFERFASSTLNGDEEDAKYLAKRKMLGNIKFIGELGKLEIVHDTILHRCCEQLLVGRKKQPLSDQAEDLECLCHLMKTCGKILDTPVAKGRMDQYFERLFQITQNDQIPIRIRFLVQDIVDLRRNKWMPRRVGKMPEGPRTIAQVREDAARDGCIYMPQEASPSSLNKATANPMALINPFEGDFFDSKRPVGGSGGRSKNSPMDDFFGTGGSGGYGSYMGSGGPGTIATNGPFEMDNDLPYDTSPVSAPSSTSPPSANATSNGLDRRGSSSSNNEAAVRNSTSPPSAVHGIGPKGGRGDRDHQHQRRDRYSGERDGDHHHQNRDRGSEYRDDVQHHHRQHHRQQQQHDHHPHHHQQQHQHPRDRGDQQQHHFRGGPPHHHHDRDGGGGRGGRHHHHHNNLPDFGDRYSANRTKDRQRREREQQQRGGGHHPGGGGGRPHDGGRGNPRYNPNWQDGGQQRPSPQHQQQQQQQPTLAEANNLPPRFKKMILQQSGGGEVLNNMGGSVASDPSTSGPPPAPHLGGPTSKLKDEPVSLRPQSTNNMVFKPKTPSVLPKSAIGKAGESPLGENSLLGPPLPSVNAKIMQTKEAPILIKQSSLDKKKEKPTAQKGPTREEVFNRVTSILDDLNEKQSTNEAVESWKENSWLPSKMTQTAVSHMFKVIFERSAEAKPDNDDNENSNSLDLYLAFVLQLTKDNAVSNVHSKEAFVKVIGNDNVNKTTLSQVTAWMIREDIVDLKEMAEIMEGGSHHPVLMLTLKTLNENIGTDNLTAMFESAGIKLIDQLPEKDKTDRVLAASLEEHGLSFLMPLLTLRAEMERALASDSSPTSFSQWISGHVETKYHTQPGFVLALFQVVFKHIVETAGTGSTDTPSEKSAIEAEKELLDKFRLVLKPFVHAKPGLQLTAVYALQVFCNALGFPKGLLLRSFVNSYEMDIMDEHAFLQWKEDVNDTYPGKGKALFQVNSWLTWLEEAESEEEDDEDEDE